LEVPLAPEESKTPDESHVTVPSEELRAILERAGITADFFRVGNNVSTDASETVEGSEGKVGG